MKIVIIGNGIAGITAARHIRKSSSEVEILVISEETPYFFSRTALMYVFMGHMKFEHTQPYENDFWKKNRIELLQNKVENIDFETKKISFNDSTSLQYDKLLLATGSVPNQLSIPNSNLKGIQGFYSKQDLDLLENNVKDVKKAVIVGGGLIGIEVAEMLISRGIEVTFIVRESNFWRQILPEAESNLVVSEAEKQGVKFLFETQIESLIGSENKIDKLQTNKGQLLDCQLLCVTIGVRPNIDFLKNSALEIDRGILVNDDLQTNIKDVFAIGDCVQIRTPKEGRRAIEQIWYTGRMMGEVVAKNLLGGSVQYHPGIFFNSAKFFNIEYQTYGTMLADVDEKTSTFVWQHATKNIVFRINFDKETEQVIGLHAFGLRLRHELIDDWLQSKKKVEFFMENLSAINFDPEFFQKFETEIIGNFNEAFQTNLKLKKQRNWFSKLINS